MLSCPAQMISADSDDDDADVADSNDSNPRHQEKQLLPVLLLNCSKTYKDMKPKKSKR